MINKKLGVLAVFFVITLLSISFGSAILEINKQEISSMAIKDLNRPAIFDVSIRNLGDADTFKIYSLSGYEMTPKTPIFIGGGETINLTLKVYPTMHLKVSPDYINLEYQIEGEKLGIQKDQLTMSIAYLKDAFDIYVESINPESTTASVHFDNKGGQSFSKISADFDSAFFSSKQDFSLGPKEKKKFDIAIDKDKSKELFAGPYILNTALSAENLSAKTSIVFQFEEKPGIDTKESSEGLIGKRYEVEKTNNGNIKTTVNIVISRGIFSALFTSFNINPVRTEMHGLKRSYIFESELSPGKSLKVVAFTNWWILIIIIVVIIIILYILEKYFTTKLLVTKKIFPVRTKGGEFALKVSLKIRARDFVEKIRLVDRLPPMVKLFEGHGPRLGSPDKIDEINRRLEWNIQALGRGEERVFEYIVYSKVGLVGKFELPTATAIYEFNGKIKDARSNIAEFNNEPKKKEF